MTRRRAVRVVVYQGERWFMPLSSWHWSIISDLAVQNLLHSRPELDSEITELKTRTSHHCVMRPQL
jgi:hypothetical protein